MLEFPDMLPWDEMTAMVKRHEEQFLNAQKVIAIQNEKFQEQITTLQREHVDLLETIVQAQEHVEKLETTLLAMYEQVASFQQLKHRMTLDEVHEDDCIF